MKKIIGLLAAVMMLFTLQSCVTAAYAQVDDMYDDGVDVSVVISYGTPYYTVEGLLMYYIYEGMYYYPYYHNNMYYFHRFHRPIPPSMHRYYRPVPRDFYKHGRIGNHHGFGHNGRPHGGGHGGIAPNTRPHGGNHGVTPRPNNDSHRFTPKGNLRQNGGPSINRGVGRSVSPSMNRGAMPNMNRGTRGVSPSMSRGGGNIHRGPSMPRSSTRGNFGGRR